MRKLFWILLLGNVVLFAAMQRGWIVWGDQEPQAQPALNRDMIRLLGSAQNPPAGVLPAAAHPAAPASAPVAVAPPHPPAPPARPMTSGNQVTAGQPAPATTALSCMEWGDFSGPDLTRVAAALADLQLGDRLRQRQVERDVGYWVYIPPLGNKAAVRRKVGELKALGISEYFVVQTAGHWHNAISLGVFKTRESAQNYLNQLRPKGVHTAKAGERASKVKATVFELDRMDAVTAAKLTAMQKDFAGSELKTVPCTLARQAQVFSNSGMSLNEGF